MEDLVSLQNDQCSYSSVGMEAELLVARTDSWRSMLSSL